MKLVIFGHICQEVALSLMERAIWEFLPLPSVCSQNEFAINDREPDFHLLYLHPDGTFTAQVERVALPQFCSLTYSYFPILDFYSPKFLCCNTPTAIVLLEERGRLPLKPVSGLLYQSR